MKVKSLQYVYYNYHYVSVSVIPPPGGNIWGLLKFLANFGVQKEEVTRKKKYGM